MGGSDDPSNLIELTVEDHAEAHRRLYEEHGKIEDKVAWLALSGHITKSDAVSIGRQLGRKNSDEVLKNLYGDNWRSIISKKGNDAFTKKLLNDESFRSHFIESTRKNLEKARQIAKTEEAKQKRKKTFVAIGHQHGEKNSNFGMKWINNGIYNDRIPKDSPLEDGWIYGRKMTLPSKPKMPL